MKLRQLIRMLTTGGVAALASFATLAQAELSLPDFAMADIDHNGFLSMTEAETVFPSLELDDTDGDGYLAKGEAEAALPGLVYTNDTHEDDEKRVGPEEYALMAEYYLRSLEADVSEAEEDGDEEF